MPFLSEFPQLQIIRKIASDKKLQVYLVGGFLRDHVLGLKKFDFDFAVSRNALKFARQFSSIIKGAYIILDEERGCARVVKKDQGRILTFDFADFRAKTFRGDLNKRDFTVNTLALDLMKLKEADDVAEGIIDLNGALKDIKKKSLKMVSSSVFKDDPLRMLRAFSLQSTLGFKIESKTLDQIKNNRLLLRDVSAERIRDEFFKILASSRTYDVFRLMDKVKLLEVVIPQLTVMYDCDQGPYHHLDVWNHTLETLRQLEIVLKDVEQDEEVRGYLDQTIGGAHSRKAIIKFALLLHDIGKPETRRIEDGKYKFYGHERAGKYIARSIAKMLRLSTHERYALEDLVLWHLRPGYLSNFKNPTRKAVFRFFRDTKEEAVSVLVLSMADQKSTRGPLTTDQDQKHHEKISKRLIREYFIKKKEKPFERLIDGYDLIKKLKMKPSPVFKEILTKVEEQQALGKITTKDAALELAKKFIKR